MEQASFGVCPYCGGQIMATASFCGSCGRPMPQRAAGAVAVQVSSQAASCPWCRGPVGPNASFCGNCGRQMPAFGSLAQAGTPMPAIAPPVPPAPYAAPAAMLGPSQRFGLRRVAPLLLGVVVIAAGGIGAAVVINSRGAGSQAPVADTPMAAPTVIDVTYDQAEASLQPATGGRLDKLGASLEVPPGALTSATTLQMKVLQSPFHLAAGAPPEKGAGSAFLVGPVVDFGPDGSSFNEPVTITVPYSEKFLPAGTSEDSIAPAYWNGQTWVALPGALDKSANSVSVRLKSFQGVPVAAVVALGAVIIGAGVVLYHKLTATDAIVDNKASTWITPNDGTVEDAAKSATLGGVKVSDHKALATYLESGSHNNVKLNLVKADGTAAEIHYTDAAGASSWQKPVDFLTKGGMTGDCTDTTNAEVSMLRSLGYPAKAVFGYQIDVDHAHAWAEVMVNGKVYMVDEYGVFQPVAPALEALYLFRPEPGDPRYKGMWDEKGQRPYDPQWWRAAVSVDPVSIGDPTKPVALAVTVDNIPSHVDKFTTVFDWGDGTEKGKVVTDADDTRKSIVTKNHSYGPTPPKEVKISFLDADGNDLTEWGVLTVPIESVAPPPAAAGDWQLVDVSVGQERNTGGSGYYSVTMKGDGRGGLTIVWESTAFYQSDGSPRSGQGDYTWQVPESFKPGTQVVVTGGVKLTEDAANCVVDDAYLASYVDVVSTDPLFQGRVHCKDESGGQAVSGSFAAPARTVSRSSFVVDFVVSIGNSMVTVTYTYK